MKDYAEAVLDALLERQVEEIIGALLAGLAVSLLAGGVYELARRKASSGFPLLVGALLMSNATSALMAGGYDFWKERLARISVPGQPSQATPGREAGLGNLLVRLADEDHDGSSTPEEVHRLVRRLVEQSSKTWDITARPGPPGPPHPYPTGHETIPDPSEAKKAEAKSEQKGVSPRPWGEIGDPGMGYQTPNAGGNSR